MSGDTLVHGKPRQSIRNDNRPRVSEPDIGVRKMDTSEDTLVHGPTREGPSARACTGAWTDDVVREKTQSKSRRKIGESQNRVRILAQGTTEDRTKAENPARGSRIQGTCLQDKKRQKSRMSRYALVSRAMVKNLLSSGRHPSPRNPVTPSRCHYLFSISFISIFSMVCPAALVARSRGKTDPTWGHSTCSGC